MTLISPGRRFQRLAIFLFVFLVASGWMAQSSDAQSTQPQSQPSATQPAATQPPTAQAPAQTPQAQAPQAQTPQAPAQMPQAQAPQAQTPQAQAPENPIANQIRLAREARARIEARRRQRREALIHDTYSHKFEIYGGGGYLRFRPGKNLQHINETAWDVGFSDYLRPRLAATGEIRGYYGTAFVGNNDYGIFKPAISQYVFLGGPQYRLVRRVHWAISAQVLAGVAKGIFNGNSANFPGTLLGLWQNGTSFAVAPAVPIDYNLGPSFAFRISPNYLFTHFGGSPQVKNLGFTAGLLIRFGRQGK